MKCPDGQYCLEHLCRHPCVRARLQLKGYQTKNGVLEMTCNHEDLAVQCQSLTHESGVYNLAIRAHCTKCKASLKFKSFHTGISTENPTTNADGLVLHAPYTFQPPADPSKLV